MDLGIKDVADLLQVSKEAVLDLVRDNEIPYYELQGEKRFSKIEINEWLMAKGDSILPSNKAAIGVAHFNLYRAMHKGGIIDDIKAQKKEDLIRQVMKQKAQSLDLDADVVTDLLLDREDLMSTGIGKGIAIPHTRDFSLQKGYDVVITVFPKEPIAYGALDNKKVHTLFFLLACSDKRHLQLLAKLAHLCSDQKTLTFLQTRPDLNKLLEFIKDFEAGFE